MHHIGISGTLGGGFHWKSLATWSRNFGKYQKIIYAIPQDEFTFLVESSYAGSKLPFDVKAGVAVTMVTDLNNESEDTLGLSSIFNLKICR